MPLARRAGSQCVVVAQGKATGVERHATAEGIVAAQGLHAGTVLDQAAGTGDVTSERGVAHATESQRAATQRHRAAGHAGQRADGLRAPCTDVERGTGIGQGHRAGRGQASARADRQRAGIDGGATGVGIAAGQGKRAGTALHQAAGATEHTAERGVAVAAAGAQGCATQQHAGPGHAGQATDALVAAGADIQLPPAAPANVPLLMVVVPV
ncbi:hypothetical protein G6F60_013648 [Rhizopus arrhizus]|nr:hypothetical protein G6F60_013648 [Rhizopus arrhizus]